MGVFDAAFHPVEKRVAISREAKALRSEIVLGMRVSWAVSLRTGSYEMHSGGEVTRDSGFTRSQYSTRTEMVLLGTNPAILSY
jgi:hypothetical protein